MAKQQMSLPLTKSLSPTQQRVATLFKRRDSLLSEIALVQEQLDALVVEEKSARKPAPSRKHSPPREPRARNATKATLAGDLRAMFEASPERVFTSREMRDDGKPAAGVSPHALLRHLAQMMEEGTIERLGDRRSAVYRKLPARDGEKSA